jgi:hypothetical protein
MIRLSRKLLLGLAIYATSFCCAATLPRVNTCYDVLCFSMVEGESGMVKDRTYHHRENGERLLVVRLNDTSQISLLVRPTSKADCPENFEQTYAHLTTRSSNSITSRGCLAVPDASRYFKVDFTLVSPKTPINLQLRTLDPQVLIRDITDIKYWSGPTFNSSVLVLSPSGHEP